MAAVGAIPDCVVYRATMLVSGTQHRKSRAASDDRSGQGLGALP